MRFVAITFAVITAAVGLRAAYYWLASTKITPNLSASYNTGDEPQVGYMPYELATTGLIIFEMTLALRHEKGAT
jgi:hypothetical protein